jgi:hypothetical protein
MRAAPLLGQGRRLGLEILSFLGPHMALAYQLDAISQGPKKSRFPRTHPLPLAPRNGSAHIKNITHGAE